MTIDEPESEIQWQNAKDLLAELEVADPSDAPTIAEHLAETLGDALAITDKNAPNELLEEAP